MDVHNLPHKDDGIYYHTDHHWTTQGAYFAYMQLAKVLGIDSSSISYDKLPVSMSHQEPFHLKAVSALLRKRKWMSFFQEMTLGSFLCCKLCRRTEKNRQLLRYQQAGNQRQIRHVL